MNNIFEDQILTRFIEFYYSKILNLINNVEEPDILSIQIGEYSIQNLKAVNLLVNNRLYAQALSVIRVISECLILLSESVKNNALFETYTKRETKLKTDSLKDRQRNFQNGIGNFSGKDSNRLNELLNFLKQTGMPAPLDVEKIAKDNDLTFYYDNFYKFCSSTIHLCPHTLAKLLKEFEDEYADIQLLKYPFSNYKIFTIFSAALCTLEIFNIINIKFKLGLGEDINYLFDQNINNLIRLI